MPQFHNTVEPGTRPQLVLVPRPVEPERGAVETSFRVLAGVMAMIARRRRDVVEAKGRRWRESMDDWTVYATLLAVVDSIRTSEPVEVDYWRLADSLGVEPGALRAAVDELIEHSVVAAEHVDNLTDLVWVNPSISRAEGPGLYEAMERHRFPQFRVTDDGLSVIPFDAIVWQLPRMCPTVMLTGFTCTWDLNRGLCPDHATDEERRREAEEYADAMAESLRRARQRAAEDRAERRRIRAHPCSACGAEPDAHCRTRTGGRATRSHLARVHLARPVPGPAVTVPPAPAGSTPTAPALTAV